MSPCKDGFRLSALLSTVITLLAPVSSDAAIYYASGDGGSDYTLPEAMELAGPGDTIQLADGTYSERLETVTDGTRESPITIVGGEDAILKPTSPAVLIKHSHIHLLGFSVDGLTGVAGFEASYINKCIWVEGDEGVEITPIDGFEMRDMLIQNCGTECVRLKNYVTGAAISENTIQNCGVYDYQFARGEKNGEGIYIGTSSKQWTYGEDRCNSNYVSGNTIVTNGNECVDIKEGSTENVIESNICSNQLDELSGCFSSRSDANTFRNNQASDCKGAGIRLGGWLVDGYQYGQTNNVYNNDVANAEVGFIKIETASQGLICGNICEDGACDVTGAYEEIADEVAFETCSPNDLQNAIDAEPFSEDSSLPVASDDDSTTEESTPSSGDDSTTEVSTSSSDDDSTIEESTPSSGDDSTTEESTSSSNDDSTTEESTSSSNDDSTTEESTSSSNDDSTTDESSSPSPTVSSTSPATSFPTSSPSFSPTSSPSWSPTWSPTSFPTYSLSPSPTESGGDDEDDDDEDDDDEDDDDEDDDDEDDDDEDDDDEDDDDDDNND